MKIGSHWKKVAFIFGLTLTLTNLSQGWAMTCRQETELLAKDPNLVINTRVALITSVDALTKFLEDTGDIDPANHQYTHSRAELFYRDLGQDGVQKIARDLLMTHRHLAQEAVIDAFIAHARGEDSGAQSLRGYFPKPLSEKVFIRWTKLGAGIDTNTVFLNKLDMAVGDFKDFEYVYGKYINKQQAFTDMVAALKGLNSPSLVGQFIEVFSKGDRLTRQYIIEEITDLKPIDKENGITVALKGAESNERNAQTKAITELLSKSPNELQELAYFDYTSNGVSNRPKLPADPQIVKTVGLRFLKRKGYNLVGDNRHEIRYATGVLVDLPIADPEIDAAVLKVFNSGTKMPQWQHQYDDIKYALLELDLLERNA